MTDVVLVDMGAIPECQCNDALDGIYKALSESPDGDERSIWAPHENPYLRQHVEEVTLRLQALLLKIQDVLARLLTGEALGTLQKAQVPWLRWDQDQFEAVRVLLELKPPETYTLDDWMLVAEYLIQRYLPDGVIQDEAEFITVRAAIMGKIQAGAGREAPDPDKLAMWAALTPTTFAAVPARVLSPVELQILHVAKARAALHISNVTDSTRSKMKELLVQHIQAQVLGQKEGNYRRLKTALFDNFAVLNRDMRRIAVTEAGEACNQGYIAACELGTRVQRVEAYRGACPFCKSINGKVFIVCAPDDLHRNGATNVWVGKSNAGRRASPNKRVGAALTERSPDEKWWPAAGLQHPFCRGAWITLPGIRAGVSPVFMSWAEGLLDQHRKLMAANDPGAHDDPGEEPPLASFREGEPES